MLKRCSKSDPEGPIFESVLIILDHYFNVMKSEPSMFLDFMKYFYSIASWNLKKEEIYVASNTLRLLIFHVSLE